MNFLIESIEKSFKKKEMLRNLSYKNIENLSKTKIRNIGKHYDKDEWYDFKKSVFISWMKKRTNFDGKDKILSKRILRKLELNKDHSIELLLFSLERREFTKRRSFKEIEPPFSYLDDYSNKSAVFVYKNTRLFDDNKSWSKLICDSDLYVFIDEILWWNDKNKEFDFKIKLSDINLIDKYDYGVNLKTQKNNYLIRYIDLDVIFISLKKTLHKFKK